MIGMMLDLMVQSILSVFKEDLPNVFHDEPRTPQ